MRSASRAAPRWLTARLAPSLLFALLAFAFVGRGTLPDRALLPIDNLFLYPPWRAHAAEYGVGVPHNPLIGDAILQNYSWKRFAAESYAAGQLPLWNPYILSGQPFLAAAQNGSLYPLGVLFFVVPLAQAYAWFIGLHLWVGAMGAYWLARILGATRLGGTVAGVTFGFCGYLVVSFLWPMVVSTAVWLPALLATIELVIRRGDLSPQSPSLQGRGSSSSLPFREGRSGGFGFLVALGATIVGLQFLAGHLEMSLYLLLTAGLYTALRLVGELWTRRWRRALEISLAALAMVGLGSALAAVQLAPFAEVISANVRGGWSDYGETVGYALPRERWLAWLVPDYWGNPTHHTYLDLLDGQVRSVEHVRQNREPRWDTEWGGKNYVEGSVYLGILPLLLAVVGLLARPGPGPAALGVVALVSLLLAFGTPLYAMLFYGLPGVNQLHTPFRWVYPFSVCVAVLAGLGASAFAPSSGTPARPQGPGSPPLPAQDWGGGGESAGVGHAPAAARWGARIGLVAAVVGGLLVVGLLGVLPFREAATAGAGRLLARFPELRQGFGEARVLFSYQYASFLGSALLLSTSGFVLLLGTRRASTAGVPVARRREGLVGAAAVTLLVGDLFSFGIGFNGVSDTRPLELVPPALTPIRADPDLFRVVTYGEDDTLPSNTNMLFGLHDVRGYDTIILREYVEYLELIEPQRGIPSSKVAKLFDQRSLSSPLLDLLNVKYVLTSKTVSQPGWTLVGESDGVRVYRNQRVLPRAFVVGTAEAARDRAATLRLVGDPSFDPRRIVVLEGWVGPSGPAETGSPSTTGVGATPIAPPSSGAPLPVEVVEYGGNRVVARASAPEGGFLVLADVFFPGWGATVDGAVRPVLRANALLRAVELTPGTHEVVFEYRPLSFRVGAFISSVAAAGLLLLTGLAIWPRLGATATPETAARRVFRNSAFPMATGLLNKVVDVAFALVMFRVLQAEGVGAYTFAGVLIGYFDILVGFGLGTLITREVAREPRAASRYLANTVALRLLFWLASVGVVLLLVGPLADPLGITPPLALTIWLLLFALLPGIVSGAISALFMAHERMALPAAVTVLSTFLKAGLGLLALFSGWGYVGLAGVAVVTSWITAAALLVLYIRTVGWPGLRLDAPLRRRMAGAALPLMVNNLLNTVFFRIDAVLLKPLAGDMALGWYSTAYKFIDGLQIIPSSFVLALFPLLSRHAESDRAKLAHLYASGLKVLLILALPISVGTTLLAEPIIQVFAGATYLPESARALQVLIWFLPLSFVNGLTQYVLIALDRQRWITLSFLIGAGVNVVANLALIPLYGYLAASWVTVASELVLLVPFWRVVRQELPSIGLLALAWRPALAAVLMAPAVWLVATWSFFLAIPTGALVYAGAILALRALDAEDREVLRSLIRR